MAFAISQALIVFTARRSSATLIESWLHRPRSTIRLISALA